MISFTPVTTCRRIFYTNSTLFCLKMKCVWVCVWNVSHVLRMAAVLTGMPWILSWILFHGRRGWEPHKASTGWRLHTDVSACFIFLHTAGLCFAEFVNFVDLSTLWLISPGEQSEIQAQEWTSLGSWWHHLVIQIWFRLSIVSLIGILSVSWTFRTAVVEHNWERKYSWSKKSRVIIQTLQLARI